MVVLSEGGRDAPGSELGLGLGKQAADLEPPELGELDGDSVDGVDGLVGLGDDGVIDIDVGVAEDRVRAGGQRTGTSIQRARPGAKLQGQVL